MVIGVGVDVWMGGAVVGGTAAVGVDVLTLAGTCGLFAVYVVSAVVSVLSMTLWRTPL